MLFRINEVLQRVNIFFERRRLRQLPECTKPGIEHAQIYIKTIYHWKSLEEKTAFDPLHRFYILFLPDTWQVLIGLITARYLSPFVGLQDMGYGARAMLFIMIAAIGYAATGIPARWIARTLIKWILGENRP